MLGYVALHYLLLDKTCCCEVFKYIIYLSLFQSGGTVCRVDVNCCLRSEEISPAVNLKTHVIPVR